MVITGTDKDKIRKFLEKDIKGVMIKDIKNILTGL